MFESEAYLDRQQLMAGINKKMYSFLTQPSELIAYSVERELAGRGNELTSAILEILERVII